MYNKVTALPIRLNVVKSLGMIVTFVPALIVKDELSPLTFRIVKVKPTKSSLAGLVTVMLALFELSTRNKVLPSKSALTVL